MWTRAVAALWPAAIALLSLPAGAQAHEPSATLVTIDATDADHVLLDIDVPLDRLEIALGTELTDDADTVVAARADEFRRMFADGITVATPDGTAYATTIGSIDISDMEGVANLHTVVTATPPTSGDVSSFTVSDSIVTDQIYSHKVYVADKNADGTLDLLGLITHYQPDLTVAANGGADSVSLGSMITVGFTHFREGTDHLLFLTLVVLTVFARRLGPFDAARRIGALTVAFTAGHSLSLLLSTLGWVTLPSRLVETGIAVTIVAAAVHATRPLVAPRLELLITLIFGLIRGSVRRHPRRSAARWGSYRVADAGVQHRSRTRATRRLGSVGRADLGADPARRRLAVARLPDRCSRMRRIVERATGMPNPVEPVATAIAATPERWALILLVGGAAVLGSLRRGRRGERQKVCDKNIAVSRLTGPMRR